MHVLILKLIYPTCNFLSAYLYAKHALVYIHYMLRWQQFCCCANLIDYDWQFKMAILVH